MTQTLVCKQIFNFSIPFSPVSFDIQAAKLAARGGTFIEYKIRKSKSGLIQRLRKEEGMPEAFS